MEEGVLGGGLEVRVAGEAREEVELEVVCGLRIAVPVEERDEEEVGEPQPEYLRGGRRTRSRLSLRRPMVEKARRFSSSRR